MLWYVNSLFGQVAAAPAVDEPSSSLAYINLLVAVGTLAVSFFLGGYLGKKLRMPDHGWKIGLSLFCLAASVAILILGPALKLGVDLRGGVILVYEIDKEKRPKDLDMGRLIDAVKKRVNPAGTKEVVIRPYGVNEIEVINPIDVRDIEASKTEVDQLKRIISSQGSLQFRILANTRDNKDLIDRAAADPSKSKLFNSAGKLEAWWVEVKKGQEDTVKGGDIAVRQRKKGIGKAETVVTEVLVVNDPYNVTGFYLTKAGLGNSEGKRCVDFGFNSAGGQLFGQLTGSHLPDEVSGTSSRLGIILDDELYSAPSIRSTIHESGQITGNFSEEEVDFLVGVLNAGSLPAALVKEPISELYCGATLGSETIRKSTNAMIIASILVPLFMLWYYRFSGLVANIALVLNMLMLFAAMRAVNAAFTLTGFAGLALTIGMAVDNNVLVYERLREELEHGATLRMAIRNAFQRASATIIDANLTTLIAAIVMYVIGTDQIKGFAVPLGVGVAISMFTSVFVARVIFDVAEKRQWITKVTMLRVIGHTNIDFMKLFPYTLTASILITVMAVGLSVARGKGLFDIDFTGGVSVQAVFDKQHDIEKIRELLDKVPEAERLPDLAITPVKVSNQDEGYQFVINTSEGDPKKVQAELKRLFGDELKHNSFAFTSVGIVPASTPAGNKSISPTKEAVPPANDTPAKKPDEPAKKDQSRRDLPPRSMLALAGDASLTVALADESAKPATAAKTAAKPAEPVKVSSPKTPPQKPLSPKGVEAAVSADNAAESVTFRPDPFAGASQSVLKFKTPINHETLDLMLKTAMQTRDIDPAATSFVLLNPDHVEGERDARDEWTLKITLPADQTAKLLQTMKEQVAASPIFPASSTIGTAVAGNMQLTAIYALVVSWICMIVYLWIRFQGVAFGLAAVVALIHDVFVMLGAVAISSYIARYTGFLLIEPFKVNLTIVAAFLTIIGYSVNDTIIVFDRIRETRGKDPNVTRTMVNDSVNQTLSRTLITSFTVFLVVVILYLSGGEAIHGFAFVLMVGVATGTYSSIYIASPILLWLVGKRHHVAAIIERK
jgi:SecD/SecF fusion protein